MSAEFMAAVDARSAEALRAALSPTFIGKANGRLLDAEAQARLIESFWTGFPDGAFKWDATGGHGHQVITWTFTGTHGGTYLGIPASGTAVTLSGYVVGRSDKTGVLSLEWKWDTKAVTRQILGPEELEEAPKPAGHRPDPSIRWAREAQRRGGGRKPKRKGTPQQGAADGARAGGPNPQRQRQPRKPEGGDTTAVAASPETAVAEPQAVPPESPAAAPPQDVAQSTEPKPDGT